MSDYADAGHRPHGIHKGQDPCSQSQITYGPESIHVTLDTWGPKEDLYSTLYNQLQSNWGDNPSRVKCDSDLSSQQLSYVESCFEGKTLQQCLELITFAFTIDGVSRACTHQLVRTRIGASVMQHGGRDNDWRHRDWTLPETIRRACVRYPAPLGSSPEEEPYDCCIDDPEPVGNYVAKSGSLTLMKSIEDYLKQGRELYSALVDSGIPWQDARRLLPIADIHPYQLYVSFIKRGACQSIRTCHGLGDKLCSATDGASDKDEMPFVVLQVFGVSQRPCKAICICTTGIMAS